MGTLRGPLERDFGPLKSDVRQVDPSPFLKWAGGKTQLLRQMAPFFPRSFRTYFEPFLGGGAVFFRLQPKRAILSDLNPELILAFQTVRDNPEELMTELDKHYPKRNDPSHYYEVRALDPSRLRPVERAARIIFLNKTCYNGLYRVNSKGAFNVPFGRYRNPTLYEPDNIKAVHRALKGTIITAGGYHEVCEYAGKDDFVYLDPPYQPLSVTSSFTGYTVGSFNERNQNELSEDVKSMNQRGCKVMLSNSATPFVRSLYEGYHIEVVNAVRAINCKGTGRGAIDELLIMNY